MEKKSILMWILIVIAIIPTIVGAAMKLSAGNGKLGTGNFAVDFLIFSPLIAIIMFALLIWLMMQPSAPKAPKEEEEPEEEEEKVSPEKTNIEAEEKNEVPAQPEEPKEEIEKEELEEEAKEEPKSKSKKVEPEKEPEVTCPVCGKPVTLDDESCPHCGAEFESEEEDEAKNPKKGERK